MTTDFIQPDDFDTFRQLLGTDEVPEKILREYSLRLNMFHKSCGSGPLGNLGIIDLLRFCGFTPANVPEPVTETDWEQVKRGQRVEAKYNGGWLAGEFLGFGQHRILLVKLDEIEEVKECRKHMVRLSNLPKPPPVEWKDEPSEELPPEELPPEQPAETGELLEHPKLAETHWDEAQAGEEVWCEINGQMQDCNFTKLLPDGQITVTFQGDLFTFPADKVIRAAMSSA